GNMKHTGASSRLRRLLVAVLLAIVVLLGLLVTLVLAQIELPPAGSVAFIQTSGPNTGLNIGDWYTHNAEGNRPHNFKIFVPCTVNPGQVFTVELFDPEVFAGVIVIDEARPTAAPVNDDATFTLLDPNNNPIATQTYPPSAATNDQWVTFTNFTSGASGCGTYTLLVSTSDDDDNAWRLRLTPDDPDNLPGTGDELLLASFEASFQHVSAGCQRFFFFVPVTPTLRLNNFDLDFPNLPATVTYFPPGGASIAVTPSGATVWNGTGGTGSTRVGDVFTNPAPGWWQAELCVDPNNQYIFEPEGLTHFFSQPPVPDMTVSKDDGLTTVSADQVVTYTISYANNGLGAALDTVLTETLPTSTTFVSCSGGFACGETPPGSGIVIYDLGTVPGGSGGQVLLTLRVDSTVSPSSTLTNTAQLDYTDTMNDDYPPLIDTDVNDIPPAAATATPTPTPTATPIPTSTPTSPAPASPPDGDDDPPPPTPTPTPTLLPGQSFGAPGALSTTTPGLISATLPVSFLPETGLNDGISAREALFLLSLFGLSAISFYLWLKLGQKGLF
ncbi:MAG TPA: hypothetical protein VEC93_03565, partial [Anaerolineae bacterium]|nr:hypothetical protein [Anaerolineae bacterium]